MRRSRGGWRAARRGAKRASSAARGRTEALEPRCLLAGDPWINEVSSNNESFWTDDRGQFSDFIELYNPDSTPIDLTGWSLTDRIGDPQQWVFPSVTLPAGGYLLISASGEDRRDPDRQLHTNFALASEGEYLALVRPDGTVAQSFNPLQRQVENVSFGRSQRVATLVAEDADFRYAVPTEQDAGIESTWMTPEFNDATWASGEMGVGFGLYDPGFDVRLLDITGGFDGIVTTSVEAEFILNGLMPPGRYNLAVDISSASPVVNFGSASGTFGSNEPFAAGIDGSNILVEVRATVTIPEGEWTLGFGSDDGGLLALDSGDLFFSNEQGTFRDVPGDNILRFDALRGHDWTTGQITVGPGGITTGLRALMFSQTDENAFELAIRQGHATGPVSGAEWQLLRDGVLGWQVGRPNASSIETDVSEAMLGVASSLWGRIDFPVSAQDVYDALQLNVRYDDGFVLYLNGQEVARRGAPNPVHWDSTSTSKRNVSDVFQVETINLSEHADLLVAGENVLAFQLLNWNADDPSLGLVMELVAVSGAADLGTYNFFLTPTPGGPNGDVQVEFVADPVFSADRGFFTEPFQLTLSTVTPGATIRYTTNGADPTQSNSLVYSEPLTITGTTVIRAAAFKAGATRSSSRTQTYLFLGDIIGQSPQGQAPAGWPTGSVNGQRFDYGMDPDIVNSPQWSEQLLEGLVQIPSFSITTDIGNLTNSSTGIYVNPGARGRAWERPASIELIDPTNLAEFQINGGIRIRGGFSRSTQNPKHAFRLFFRGEYGDGALEFPLFGDEGADRFENVDLRTTQNYSWAFQGDSRNTFVRDIFSRDVQGALGSPYTRGRFYHLYLNGVYWGLYQTDERAEASFAETYLGGDESDYDVVKNGGPGTEATDGDLQAYRRLWQATNAGFATNEAYYRVQGMNPDGTRNPAFERLVDVDNLIDYMIITYFTADMDGPGSRFTQPRPNNFVGIYNRNNPDGFKWIEHDSEHSLNTGAGNMVDPLTINHSGFNAGNFTYFNPHWLHERMAANAEYRQRFADRVQRALFGDGPLSLENAKERIQAYADVIDLAIVAESARWGDAQRSSPYTKTNWQNAVDAVLNWFNNRHAAVLGQLRPHSWYPAFDGPQVLVEGVPTADSAIDPDDVITFAGSADGAPPTQLFGTGVIWNYLDNGSDPGTEWRNPGYDDSSWKFGRAEFGYGDGDETTVVSFGDNPQQKHVTTYFRRGFNLLDATDFNYLIVRLRHDDGAVVYINGEEVVRSNMPGGEINGQTLATTVVSGANETNLVEFRIDNPKLVTGINTVAVEIHQATVDSTDVSFDMALLAGKTLSAIDGVYYTLDGSDPRLIGGELNPNALPYTGEGFTLDQSAHVKARVLRNEEWSVLAEAELRIDAPPEPGALVISELHFHPIEPDTSVGELDVEPDEFEFIELMNVSENTLDLTGLEFTDAIEFTFPLSSLAPNQRIVIVKNHDAFLSRYPDFDVESILGVYDGNLSNSGERIELSSAIGDVLLSFQYDDMGDWPNRADGSGSSMELDPLNADPSDPDSWSPSIQYHGTPGAPRVEVPASILVNEILANSEEPTVDAIELVNITSQPVDIGGWYMSDTVTAIKKYKFPATVIPPGGYLVVTEAQFNLGGGTNATDFALSSGGDDVWLVAADEDGRLLRFVDRVEFGGTDIGVSLGRLPNAHPDANLVPLADTSLGVSNGAHRPGELVISEIHYNPPGADTGLEFIELTNASGDDLNIGGWRIRGGVSFDIPADTSLAPGASVVVVGFNPATVTARNTFVAAFPQAATATLLGPWENNAALSNSGERLTVQRPATTVPVGEETPYILVDEADYDVNDPWPVTPDGEGTSLNRLALGLFGSNPGSWVAADPSPGAYTGGLVGDVNLDKVVDATDLDLIAAAIQAATYEPRLDLIHDLKIDEADQRFVFADVLGSSRADIDLDHDVDAADLLEMLAGWTGALEPGTGPSGWATGDTDGDRDTDAVDLLNLFENFTGAGAVASAASPRALLVDAAFGDR